MPLPGPDTRVVELRVAGLVGTSGESLLDSVSAVDVAGDGIGRIVRPSDRLHRPAPGPVLKAIGRSIPRTLEGYLWSGMTSGGAAKAMWALLFPFSLANVAHWMLPPVRSGSRSAAIFGAACRSLLRMAALLLTMLLVSQLAVISTDLLATQCLAPGSTCLPWTSSWLRGTGVLRTAVGVVPPVAVIVLLHVVSTTNWPVRAPGEQAATGTTLPGDTLRSDPTIPVARCLHSMAALASVGLLLLGGPLRLPTDPTEKASWIAAMSLLGIAVLGTALLEGGNRLGRFVPAVLGKVQRRFLLCVAALIVLIVAIHRTPLPAQSFDRANGGIGSLTGAGSTVEGIGAALLVVCLLFGLLLIPAALLGRSTWNALPKRLRPWVGGWAAAPVLALSCLAGAGFGAGLAIALRQLIGADALVLPAGYTLITILWGAGLAIAVVLGVLGFAVAVPLRRRKRGIPDAVNQLQTDAADKQVAATAWAHSSWERRHLHHIVLAIVIAMSAGVLGLLALRLSVGHLPDWLLSLSGLGVVALGGLAGGLLRVIYTAATKPQRSRHLGALADLVCFWPRAAHPTVPPCYALKVVPELVARAKQHLAEPNTRVVLAGYSLGGLLAVIAAARLTVELSETERERLGLLTAGTPLQWGYQRAFPAVLSHTTLARLYGRLPDRWRGLCRGTDSFGGGVTTWRHQMVAGSLLGVGYLPDGSVGPLPAAVQAPTGALVLGGDHWLADPMRHPGNGHRLAPGVLHNSDYLADPEWDHAVTIAAGLERPARNAPLAEQVPLFGELPTNGPAVDPVNHTSS